MPPKVSTNVKTTAFLDDNRLSAVDKEFFTFQFGAIENTIARLNNNYIILEKDTDKYKTKANDLNIKLKNEYGDAMKILEEKTNYEKKLKAEIEELLQGKDSMVEINRNRLKEKDDEFMRAVGIIKTTTAVYVGRLNKLKEFCKQEEILEEKLINMEQQIEAMNKNYEVKLKKLEEKYFYNRKVIQKGMLQRCFNFAFHTNKLFMSDLHPRVQKSSNEILDLEDMLKKQQVLNMDLDKQILQKREENKRFLRLIKSNAKNIDTLKDTYYTKEEKVKGVKKELAEVLEDVNRLLENLDKDMGRTRQKHHSKLRSAVGDAVLELQSLSHDMHIVQEDLSGIQATNRKLDEFIWEIEDLLLKTYGKTLNHAEEIKCINKEDRIEKPMQFIQQLYTELEPFMTISEDFTRLGCQSY
ncbi:Hypothetical protein CINCED_3A024090 [Cinara cedri]|uniref:Uncharacterized protein n=1 Tax=Cinara cedri TaxID=506608 RepID=A0A5E4MBS6_9HEMI|nr:Hypothetical protein CINCED_3A024090 [Cinara cedri]